VETKEERRKVIDQLIEDRVDELYKFTLEYEAALSKTKRPKKTTLDIDDVEAPF
jgi:hypothetical protein